MVTLTFPDGSKHDFKAGATGMNVAESIGPGLARSALGIVVDGKPQDLSTPINKDAKISILTFKDAEGVEIFRHSTAHLLAQAVLEVFPETKITIGPVVEEGFYYDLDHPPFTPEDIEKIEKNMKEIVERKLEVSKVEMSKAEALKTFKDNPYKVEIIKGLPDGETITAYKQGEFIDLCRGPHVPNTSYIKSFKLTKVSSAYWKGDAKNKSLQRIYGISFPDKKELKQYLHMQEEAKKRDHRKIGKDMDLFSIHEEAPGMPFFHSKGTFIWNTLVDFMRSKMRALGYEENKTPMILNKELWLQSGHWEHYKENMYFTKIDEADFAVKPMNCPGNLLVYKATQHSYKELPIKAGEFGLVHRHELSGVLAGLFRVRAFTQDDAHVFCMEEQLLDQVIEIIDLIDDIYSTFGFEYTVELSTKPENALGSQEVWDKAEGTLKKSLETKNMKYKINEGDGAFYGPKIDYHLKDTLGRTWQCGTIQVDFSFPEKFDLTYEGSDGKKHRPVMIHRAIYGSVERFMGILIEHYAGKFPLWLSPVQVRVLTVADRHERYAKQVFDKFNDAGRQVELDNKSESIPKKVRNAQLEKVNYILVVGDKEMEAGTVNVRTRDNVVHGEKKVDTLLGELLKEIAEKK